MTDDLGKQVTQAPGFEWERGMVVSCVGDQSLKGAFVLFHKDTGHYALDWNGGVFRRFPQEMSIDLDHPANTGFLLALANSVCSKAGYWRFETGCDVPILVVNRHLARTIIAATEKP